MSELNEDFILEDEGGFDDMDVIGHVIHLQLDDDQEMDAIIVAYYGLEKYEQNYVALLPMVEGEDEEESDVLLYRFDVAEDGTPSLGTLESEEEYDDAAKAFYEELEAMESTDEEE